MALSDIILARQKYNRDHNITYKPVEEVYPILLPIPRVEPGGMQAIEPHPFGGWRMNMSVFWPWCRDTLGYLPPTDKSVTHFRFRNDTDVGLFTIAFAEWFI